MLLTPVVLLMSANDPKAVSLRPEVLVWPACMPMKVLLLLPLERTSMVRVLLLFLTSMAALAKVIALTDTAEITPLKLVVGVKVSAPVVLALITKVCVVLAPSAWLLTPPIVAVTVLLAVVLLATVKTIW